jgi:DNA-directed RNA polymerase subunit RPC12/RpoP
MKYKCASCGAYYNGLMCPMCGSVVTTEVKYNAIECQRVGMTEDLIVSNQGYYK